MLRPEVRIIENQYEESKEIQISDWEKQQLLKKYGYSNQSIEEPIGYSNQLSELSYQQVMELEDRKFYLEQQRRQQELMNRPRVYGIDHNQVKHNETRWSNMNLDGQDFGIEVSIVSDMKFK